MEKEELDRYRIRDYYMIPTEIVDNVFYEFETQLKKQQEVNQKAIEYIKSKENGRGFKITSVKQYNIDELVRCKNNWNELRKYIKEEIILDFYNNKLPFEIIVENVLNKMKELEQGSDSNENN